MVQREKKVPPSTTAAYSYRRSPDRQHISRSHSPQQGHQRQGGRRESLSRSRSPGRVRGRGMSTRRSNSPPPQHNFDSHSGYQRGHYMSQFRSRSPRGYSLSKSRSPSPQQVRQFGSLSPEQEQRDQSRSLSPSEPVIGRKRSCSSSEDGLQLVKAQKVSEGGGRPKASDYDDVSKEVILRATAIYRCLVSTCNAFPTPSEETELIKGAWNRANEETSQEVPIALTPVIAKVVSVLLCYS